MDLVKVVLVVDDDALLLLMLRDAILVDDRLSIIPVGSGYEALMIIDAGGIDLMILDLMMGDISGLDVLEALKDKPKPPILVLTAIGNQPWTIKKALDLGATEIMAKPFDPQELMDTVCKLLKLDQ